MAARSRRDLRNPPDHFGSKRRETSNAAARPQPPPRVLDRQLPQEQPSRVKVRLARRGYNTAAAPALAVLCGTLQVIRMELGLLETCYEFAQSGYVHQLARRLYTGGSLPRSTRLDRGRRLSGRCGRWAAARS